MRNGQKAVNDVSGQLRQEMSDRLNLQVLDYLERPYVTGHKGGSNGTNFYH
ncbi:hypothetical protein [Nostoc sp.]|uniref:hypothetical protein n=1 Tax=Nostoc sp. TaxID=1180 RepID=UPI002FFC235A